MKKKGIILTLKKHSKKRAAVFAVGFLVIVLAAIILFNPLSGKINHFTKFVSEKFSILSAELPTFFFPNFPQRLMYVASEISAVSEELVTLNEELLTLTKECDCKYAASQCQQVNLTKCQPGPVKVFGEPCLLRSSRAEDYQSTIEGRQAEINDLTLWLSFLQKLLKEEMDAGLEKQLATLRPEDAQTLRENLQRLLDLSPKIKESAEKNMALPDQCSVQNCSPNCQQGTSFQLNVCATPGQQKPTKAKFKGGVSLDDLKPGKVGIKNINLSLPEEIEMPALPELPGLTISIPDITLTCPKETRSLTFHTPTPTLPDAPTLKLSCPIYPSYSSYQCAASPEQEGKSYLEAEWYFKTFSHLSEKCLGVIQIDFTKGVTEAKMDEYQSLMKDCMTPEKVAQTVAKECEKKWKRDCGLFGCGSWYLPDPVSQEICGQIGRLPQRTNKAIEWCNKLFQDERETPPATCSSNPTGTTQQKCDDIRNTSREEPPLSCKLLPLFVGRLEDPSGEVILGQAGECPVQTIGDYPNPVAGCELAFPSAPTISFPKIIIPDIQLPSFNFPPFFRVKLPNFIFEDLILPDLDLCNLDDCQFQFPYLSFEIPSLKIPDVKVPPALIDIPGVPQIEVGVAPIEFPPLAFNFPQLINLSSLATPELEMPGIPLPQPKLQLSFLGLEVDLMNLLLGLFQTPDACISAKIDISPISLVYPDYIFGWPAFPRIPEIPFCKDARQFCKNAKGSIQEITAKTNQIQSQVNAVFQSEIQRKLDQLAISIQEEIGKSVKEQLDEQAEKIRSAIENHIAKYAGPEYTVSPETGAPMPGVWPVKKELPCDKIPALTIPMENIVIEPKPLSEYVHFEPSIHIDWPDSLKKIILSGEGLSYELPDILLSLLSYSKDVNIRLPGTQRTTPTINFNLLENATACTSQPPGGGNPCQPEADQIQTNLEIIKGYRDEIGQSSQNIKDVLY